MRIGKTGAINSLFYLAATLLLVAVFTDQAPAQTSGSRPSPIDRRVEQMQRQREQHERDTLRGKAGTQNSSEQRSSQEITQQVKQDFERIQAVYNDIVLAISAGNGLDYKFVSNATGEVRKLADRLKKNLALPEPDTNMPDNNLPDAKPVSDVQEEMIKPALEKLCRHIVSFVTNPLFETSGLLDVEQATKASKDLAKIIELSQEIESSASRLNGIKK